MRVLHSLFLCPVVCLAQATAPVISFDKTHHNFGKMSPNKNVSHKFTITNTGNAPLHIKEVRESCNCSKATVPKWRLNPGESTFIEVRFSSIGMIGNVQKSVELISDDPANPKQQLTFEASVIHEVMPSASVVFFSEISRFSTASSTIRLESGNEQPVVVTDVKVPVPYLFCETHQEGNDVILNVTINGQLIPKQNSRGIETLVVQTTNEKYPALQFSVQWDALSAITASQNRIVWNGTAGNELRTTISLNHSGGKVFRVLGAESTSPFIKAVILSKNSATEHKLDVVMTAEAKAGMYHEKLTVKLDDPEQSELEIGVAAVLR